MNKTPSQSLQDDLHAGLLRLLASSLTVEQQAILQDCMLYLEKLSALVEEDLAQMESENTRLAAAVQDAIQAKTKFVSVVTHELRIPMTSIKGYTDLMRKGTVGPVNEMQSNFLNIIRNNVERMSALVSDLSDISHIDTGRMRVDLALISLPEVIKDTLNTWQVQMEEKKIQFAVEIPSSLPKVYSDPNRISQVINHLLSNAWRYTPAEGCVNVRAREETDGVRFEVIDTGIGISPKDQELLFSPFFRSDDPAVREQQGWGLGLCLCKKLMELMGGQIAVESVLKQGSTFWVILPIQEKSKEG